MSTEPAPEPTLERISGLSEEEHALRERESRGEASDEDRLRLSEIEVLLDQCWDLLRQRRARRNAGLDPDDAKARAIDTVEDYEQ